MAEGMPPIQPYRLSRGGRVDRLRSLAFTFDGRRLAGHPGDTVASALLANGVHLVGRSFKYHRPRGIVTAGAEEPNALIQLRGGARSEPNIRATQADLFDGLEAWSQNRWPSLEHDLGAVNDVASRLIPAGFYYKTFMWPPALWMTYERWIRRAAGLGRAPEEADPDRYDQLHAHCDVLVAGAGPAGLAAALAAGRAGARVIVADEQSEAGGRLLADAAEIDGAPAVEWVAAAWAELRAMDEVTCLTRSTVFGYYDHNYLAIAERIADHKPAPEGDEPRQRLWRVRARQVVLATGAIERPLVFRDNDRPGIMTAAAVRTYIGRFGVAPGLRCGVFTNNDDAYRTVLALADAGVEVPAVVDLRPAPEGPLVERVRARGIRVLDGHGVGATRGGRRIAGFAAMRLSADGSALADRLRTGFDCDSLAVSGGWNPVVHLFSQSGGRLDWRAADGVFVPGAAAQATLTAGAMNGSWALGDCLREGLKAGAVAAAACDRGSGRSPRVPTVADVEETPPRVLWAVPSDAPWGRGGKHFVDFQNDVTVADIRLAHREGYESVEHLKRYTTSGMGTDQGKLGNVAALGLLAELRDAAIPAVGTTTFRPPYTPVTFGLLAGRDTGPLLDIVRRTPMHERHEALGADFEDVGQWKRPYCYPRGGEDREAAVLRETRAVRAAVGLMDVSTLGKIDLQGPDAGTLLDRVYTNVFSTLKPGRCRYGLMLTEAGMVMDDGVTTRLGPDRFHMTTTTGGAARVLAWLEEWLQTEWTDLEAWPTSVTEQWAVCALAGPKARAVLGPLTDIDLTTDAFPFMSLREGTVAGVPARVFRISFSGELSYEINVAARHGPHLWDALMAAGSAHGITPYGTEAMHVLRAEKGYVIVGQDTDGTATPDDLGMSWIVSRKKPDFIGKRSLARPDMLKDDRKQLVGLVLHDDENPSAALPEGTHLVAELQPRPPMAMIGHVTSSYWSAALGRRVALAMVRGGRGLTGQTRYAVVDGEGVRVTITDPVFYDREGERQNG